jgi:protein TonB
MLRAMALSVVLHTAVVMVVRPAPAERPATWVINAHILPQPETSSRPAPVPSPVPPRTRRRTPALVKPKAKAPVAALKPATSAARKQQPTPPVTSPQASALPAVPNIAEAPLVSAEPPPAPITTPRGKADSAGTSGEKAAPSLPQVPMMLDTTWYTAREVDVQPRALQPIKPIYPREARQTGIQGSVVLEIHLDELGEVQELKVIEADPPGVFDDSALTAFAHARFTPARKNGRPVRVVVKIRVTYELTD